MDLDHHSVIMLDAAHDKNSSYPQWPLSFPPELLVRILYLSLSDSPFYYIAKDQYGDPDLSLNLSRMTTPFTLGAICRHWRHIVWQDPNMWNRIYLVANPHKAGIQAWLLENWLSRIGSLLFSIDIDCSIQDHKGWTSQFANASKVLMEPIFRYHNRCESFRTRLPPQCLLPPSERAGIQQPYFEGLKTLDVVPMGLTEVVDPFTDEEEEVAMVSIFQSCTRLGQLALGELEVEQLDLPWSSLNLTTISTRCMSLVDCLLLMKYAPNLEICNFYGIGYPEIDFDDSHNVVLPCLRALILDFTEISSAYEIIFRHITTPNLKQLQFWAETAAPFPIHDFVLFLQRSGCQLTDLEIKGANMTADAIKNCLLPIRQFLKSVRIIIPNNTQEQAISFMIPPSCYLPSIRTATLEGPASVIKGLFPSP